MSEGGTLSDSIDLHRCQRFVWRIGGGAIHLDAGVDVGEGEAMTTVGAAGVMDDSYSLSVGISTM